MSYVKCATAITVLSSSILILVEISFLHHQAPLARVHNEFVDRVALFQMNPPRHIINRTRVALFERSSLRHNVIMNITTIDRVAHFKRRSLGYVNATTVDKLKYFKRSSSRHMNKTNDNTLQMCESNQAIRLKHAQMYNGSLKDCLFSYWYMHRHSKRYKAISTKGDRTKACINTVVERCSEHKGTFTSSNKCVRCIKNDHSKIAVRDSLDIFVAVRTCSSNHGSRLSLQMLTWMQLIYEPRQVHIITDVHEDTQKDGDVWINAAKSFGFVSDVTGCGHGHDPDSLCCKLGTETKHFYDELARGKDYRWFCFFDDDVYVNVPSLVRELKRHRPLQRMVYLGHAPTLGSLPIEGPKSNLTMRRFAIHYAFGASYCISVALMRRLEPFLRGSDELIAVCHDFSLPDDVIIGCLIEGHFGHRFINLPTFLSHNEVLATWYQKPIETLVSFGYKGDNVIESSHLRLPKSIDPTRFLSFHCLMFPEVSWCKDLV